MTMTLAVTGHRPNKLGGYDTPNPTYDAVRRALRTRLLELRPTKVLTGMALGVDQWVAELCIELQIPFVAVIPFPGQEKAWPRRAQRRYHTLLAQAVDRVIVSPGPYAPEKMHLRNEWLVEHADELLSVWDGSPGGTSSCRAYALKEGCPITDIDPTTLA